jgi:hypothetical protein
MAQAVTSRLSPASWARIRFRTGASWRIRSSVVSELTVPQQFHRSSSTSSTPRAPIAALAERSKFAARAFRLQPG